MKEPSSGVRGRTVTQLIHDGAIDSELAALLWLLFESNVPIVAMVADGPSPGVELRAAIEALTVGAHATADGAMPGGVLRGTSLEDALATPGMQLVVGDRHDHGGHGPDIPDEARDLGVVIVLGEPATGSRVLRAHYVRPVERDKEGHVQRRPPALLSAANDKGVLDHFFWAINDELATRTDLAAADFEREHARRSLLLRDMVAAHVFDETALRRHIDAAQLAGGANASDGAKPA
jgi:hypothetical protein